MQLAGIGLHGGRNTVFLQAGRVNLALRTERVEAREQHQRRRQSLQRRGQQRRGAPILPVLGLWNIEIDEPAHGLVGEDQVLGEAAVVIAAHREIDGGIQEDLRLELDAGIAHGEGNGCRQIAASAVATDGHAAGVHAQHVGVGLHPMHGGEAVLVGCGEYVLRRHAVVDRDHGTVCGVGDLAADPVMAVEVAQHPAAAVIVDEHRQHAHVGGSGAAIDADGHRAVRAAGRILLDAIDLRQIRLRHHPSAPVRLARLQRRQCVDRWPPELLDKVEVGLAIGVELHGFLLVVRGQFTYFSNSNVVAAGHRWK